MVAAFENNGFRISTDKSLLDARVIHQFLSGQSYWATGIPESVVRRSIENSLCFGVYHEEKQIGFARLVTDFATVAYLADVFILDEYRGKGLSKWLLSCITSLPELQGLRRWMLATRDAHTLYTQFGFQPLARPEIFMERHHPNIYQARPEQSLPNS